MALLFMGIAALTQGVSSAITYKKNVDDAYDRAKSICAQIDVTEAKMKQVDALRSKIGQAQSISSSLEQELSNLNGEIIRQNTNLREMKEAFKTKFVDTLVLYIFLTTLIVVYIIEKHK